MAAGAKSSGRRSTDGTNPGPSTVDEAREAVARNPGQVKARLALARLLFDAADYEQAEAECSAVLAEHPDNVPAINRMFAIAQRREDPERALIWARRGAELQPDSARMFLRLGVTAMLVYETKEAIDALERSLELEPGKANTLRSLAEAYIRAPNWGKAMTTAQQVADMLPDDPAAQILLLRATMNYGDFDLTMKVYYRIVALAPDHEALPSMERHLDKIYRKKFRDKQIVRAAPQRARGMWARLFQRAGQSRERAS